MKQFQISAFESLRITPLEDPVSDLKIEDESQEIVVECIKRTYQPKVLRKKRKHGFLSRVKSKNGRKVLNRRREKGRHVLAV